MAATSRDTSVSLHEATIFAALCRQPDRWRTHREIHEAVPTVAARTVRHHARRLADRGLLARQWIFPEYRYRIAASPPAEALVHAERLRAALDVLGIGVHVPFAFSEEGKAGSAEGKA